MTEDLAKPEPPFKFGKIRYQPQLESKIPAEVTNNLLEGSTLSRENIRRTVSATLELFIIDQFEQGKTEEEVAELFVAENLVETLEQQISTIDEAGKRLGVETVIESIDTLSIVETVVGKLEELGASQGVLENVRAKRVEFRLSSGESYVTSDGGGVVSVGQIVRKAIDFVACYPQYEFVEVLEILARSTGAHEIGHFVDDALGKPTIRMPHQWHKGNDGADLPDERFAEYWGRVVLNQDEKEIRQKEWQIHVFVVKEAWKAAQAHGRDMMKVFRLILGKLDSGNVKDFVLSRRGIYGNVAVENYADPYDEETIRGVIQSSTT